MELREKIADIISEGRDRLIDRSSTEIADAILDIPEIKEALEAKQFAYNEGYRDGLAAGREEAA